MFHHLRLSAVKLFSTGVLLLALLINAGEAQSAGAEEVVVTATRLEEVSSEVASSHTVITEEEIEESQHTMVDNLLLSATGLNLVQDGVVGGNSSIFIRGAKSAHTLYLIDGVEMNDPSSPNRVFDLGNMTAAGIERIEVVRGPQSTLYGSDAMGGIINIITKKGGKGASHFLNLERGSYKTYTLSAGTGGATGAGGRINYSVSAMKTETDGFSAASEELGNTEDDGYSNTTISLKGGYEVTDDIAFDLMVRHTAADTELDITNGFKLDDPNYSLSRWQTFSRGSLRAGNLFDGLLSTSLAISYSDQKNASRNGKDGDHPNDLTTSNYKGKMLKAELQNTLYLDSKTVTFGIERERESAASDLYIEGGWGTYSATLDSVAATTTGYYIQDQFTVAERVNLICGYRVDHHSNFGSHGTYRIGANAPFGNSTIKGTYGTGFKAPSLTNLFDPNSGNDQLQPEESTGWDIGLTHALLDGRASLGVTYFSNDFKNLIDIELANPLTFTYLYFNVDTAASRGFEIEGKVALTDALTVRGNFTVTDSEDSDGMALIRIAEKRYGLTLNYRPNDRAGAAVTITGVGERDDKDFNAWPVTRVKLAGYMTADLAASYRVSDKVTLTGRIENLLDEGYENVFGYGTAGRSGYLGLKMAMN